MVDWVKVSKGTQEALKTKRGLPIKEAFAELIPKTPGDAAMAIAVPAGMGAGGRLLGTLGKKVLSAAHTGGVEGAIKTVMRSGAGEGFLQKLGRLFYDLLEKESMTASETVVMEDALTGISQATLKMFNSARTQAGTAEGVVTKALRGGRF